MPTQLSYGTFSNTPDTSDGYGTFSNRTAGARGLADGRDDESDDSNGEESKSKFDDDIERMEVSAPPLPLVELLVGPQSRPTPSPDWEESLACTWNIPKQHSRNGSWFSDPGFAEMSTDCCTVDLSMEFSLSGELSGLIDSMDDGIKAF